MRFFNGPEIRGNDGRVHWALMSSFDIPCRHPGEDTDRLYLRRLRIVQTPWFGVYLHEMHGPDADRDLHDHPWNFYTFILKGGYTEQWRKSGRDSPYENYSFYWPRWSGHVVNKLNAHRITGLLKVPTYTLVFVGRRTREWGFWTKSIFGNEHEFIKWDEYHEVHGEGSQIT